MTMTLSLNEQPLSQVARTRIPPRFHEESLASYVASTPSQIEARRMVVAWMDALRGNHGPMLALVGRQGTGKSHLLYGVARELFAQRIPVFVRPWYDLADALRYGQGGKDSQAIRKQLWDAQIVLIDEVRPTASTAFDDTELAKFACHAYDQRISVLVTTNVNPLDQVMGPAAASRFKQVVIEGTDYRQERAA